MTNTNNHLANIATRQRSSRLRDAVFAACVALAALVSVASVSTACDAATMTPSTHIAQR
jgi:hypothetical protein